MRDVIVILGGNALNVGIINYCHEKGYFAVVVDWSPNAFLKGDLFLCIDVKDSDRVIEALEANHIRSILGTYTSIDLAVASMNAINRHFGLQSMQQTGISNALPKEAMTQVWNEAGILNRYSHVFSEFDEEIMDAVTAFETIFKPNISSSSRGITILQKGAIRIDVEAAFEKAKAESYDHSVIVEEFIDGTEFTCDMLGDAYGNVSVYGISVKYHTLNTNSNKIAIKLHYNSDIYSDDVYIRIAETGRECYRALGFKASFGHLEIMMKKDGTLSPIEIGARSSGNIANPLVSLASGHDYFGDYLNVLNGGRVSGKDYIDGLKSSMYFFYDIPHGAKVIHPCSILDFLPRGIESAGSNRDRLMQIGYCFGDISNDNERVGYEILHGERHLMSIHTIEIAEQEFIKYLTQE